MVPRIQAAFPRCIATLRCCIRNILTLVSSHTACFLRPKSLKNSMAQPPNAPNVSIAIGWKMYVESSTDKYYCRFIISASVATTPGPRDSCVEITCCQSVWTSDVTYKTATILPCHRCYAVWSFAVVTSKSSWFKTIWHFR